MKCLTVKQPYAWAIIAGHKRVENRSWSTSFRGRLLIHAGKSLDALTHQLPDAPPPADQLAFGAIIGYVDVVDCVPVEDVAGDPYAFGPWCFVLANPVAIEPIPMAGKLGLFEVDLEAPAIRPIPKQD